MKKIGCRHISYQPIIIFFVVNAIVFLSVFSKVKSTGIFPFFASLWKTILEKFVNLLNLFLFRVKSHLFEINVFELRLDNLFRSCKAFNRIKLINQKLL